MFGLGILEIALVALVVVVLFPPTEIPKLARSLARAYGSVRRVADEFRHTVLQDDELNEPVREIRNAYQETRWQLRQAEEAARRDLSRASASAKSALDPTAPRKRPAGTVAGGERPSPSPESPTSASEDSSGPSVVGSAPPHSPAANSAEARERAAGTDEPPTPATAAAANRPVEPASADESATSSRPVSV
ncbi:MAG: hypothetical protein B7733_07630 [Myxococcales bacterium FL481]|nr:MAG: hypothetical protein B7733_07630 [Myxococcales bacterium FL481]